MSDRSGTGNVHFKVINETGFESKSWFINIVSTNQIFETRDDLKGEPSG